MGLANLTNSHDVVFENITMRNCGSVISASGSTGIRVRNLDWRNDPDPIDAAHTLDFDRMTNFGTENLYHKIWNDEDFRKSFFQLSRRQQLELKRALKDLRSSNDVASSESNFEKVLHRAGSASSIGQIIIMIAAAAIGG